jgi:hypothetical protein
MGVGKYLRRNIRYYCREFFGTEGFGKWDEEEEKLSVFLGSDCLSYFLAPSVVKKQYVLTSTVMEIVLS